MEYVVVKTGGKQYKVSKDSIIEVEKLPYKTGEKFEIEDVLLHVVDGKVAFGKPKLSNVKVGATVLEQYRGEKLRVFKFKAKSKYRKTTGHRQYLTRIKINEIKV